MNQQPLIIDNGRLYSIHELAGIFNVHYRTALRWVQLGEIDPENVVTPGIFVDRLVTVAEPKQEETLNREGAAYPEVAA